MTDIGFYHLTKSGLDRALPQLLAKTMAAKKRALVVVGSDQMAKSIDDLLWTFDKAAWMPHGLGQGEDASDQPILISIDDANNNAADFLFLADGGTSATVAEYERCFELFDGNDDMAVQAARQRWKSYKEAGHAVTYWQQGERGWEQKA